MSHCRCVCMYRWVLGILLLGVALGAVSGSMAQQVPAPFPGVPSGSTTAPGSLAPTSPVPPAYGQPVPAQPQPGVLPPAYGQPAPAQPQPGVLPPVYGQPAPAQPQRPGPPGLGQPGPPLPTPGLTGPPSAAPRAPGAFSIRAGPRKPARSTQAGAASANT